MIRVALAGILALLSAVPVMAQPTPGCAPLCAVSCVKPISIPDRWDDVTGIAGYMGGGRNPEWRNNNSYDYEDFVDGNANRLYDSGEAYVDGNGNGIHDAEAYDPLTTGYVGNPAPAGDGGLELTLHPPSFGNVAPGVYFAIALPPLNRGTPITGSDAFRENFATCNPVLVGPGDRLQEEAGTMASAANQLMRDLIAQDPKAVWNESAHQVEGSAFPQSPRVIFFPVHDPRTPIPSGGPPTIVVTKIAAFFMEEMTGLGEVRGRFLRATGTGQGCAAGTGDAGFVIECATPATATSWGKIKSTYR
jgi:hypothetical protein